MKKLLLIISLISLLSLTVFSTKLLHYPDISNGKVVFVYAGNLWIVSENGGIARQLTYSPGDELFPRFSPDGKYIAFSGSFEGNFDLYLISTEGGIPKRLTYHPDSDRLVDWYLDGKHLLFLSRRNSWKERFARYFKISIDGGFPELLPLPKGGLASFSPDGTKIAYNRIDRDFRHWKRYMGGMAQDISIYDLKNNIYKKITHYKGTDHFPMWYKNKIFFCSDRDGRENIYYYNLKNGKIKQVTHFKEYDVTWPAIGGNKIVFENGGDIYLLNLKNLKYKKLNIVVNDEGVYKRPHFVDGKDFIDGASISPHGKRVVLTSRGEIFSLPVKKGVVKNISNSQGIRERDVKYSPNGKNLAYFSDKSGEYNLYIYDREKDSIREVKLPEKAWYFNLKWSPDSKKIAFSNSKMNLFYLNLEDGKITKVDNFPYNHSIRDFNWSGDSNYLTYSKGMENDLSAVFIYSIKDGKIHQITSGFSLDVNPAFDKKGDYIFFISYRNFMPQFNTFDNSFIYKNGMKIYGVALRNDVKSILMPENDEVKVKEEKKDSKENKDKEIVKKGKEAEKKKEDKNKEKKKDIKIDFEGIGERLVVLPIKPGTYHNLNPIKGGILFLDAESKSVKFYNYKNKKVETVIRGVDDYDVSYDGKYLLYSAKHGKLLGVIKTSQRKQKAGSGKINISGLKVYVIPQLEWKQIYKEAWRLERDFFYVPNYNGVNWNVVYEKYAKLLPFVAHRSDLNYLIGEMIGELHCSHTYVFGGSNRYFKAEKTNVGLLGVDYEIEKGFYKIKKIYRGEMWDKRRISPLNIPGLKVKEGDYILAVNGLKIKPYDNIFKYFQNTAGKEIELTINSKPTFDGSWKIIVKPISSELQLRYIEKIRENRKKVEKATNGKVGYIHLPSTGVDGLNELYRAFLAQHNKKGLIIDVRYNNGGMIPDRFIELLSRKIINYWATQNTKGFETPYLYSPRHMVCIINSYAGSGGDAFPYYFRKFKLGKLIGTRTWGGLVGISRNITFTDGGMVTIPEFGIYTPDGKWVVENEGVSPDIEIDNRPDLVVKGKDPQLEKAIEVILKEIKGDKYPQSKKPPLPIRK